MVTFGIVIAIVLVVLSALIVAGVAAGLALTMSAVKPELMARPRRGRRQAPPGP